VAYRLYLPEAWTSDAARRKKAGVPDEIGFATKPRIALEQIRAACENLENMRFSFIELEFHGCAKMEH
jgi:SRSO17 transposase